MRLFDFLSSTKRPKEGAQVCSAQQVRDAILALNRDTAPYQIVDGGGDGADYVAEWRIVDAQWYEIFAKAGIEKVFRILLKLDEAKREVRAVDREYSVEWRAGVPTLSLAVEAFRGQKTSMEFGKAYAFKEEGGYGQVYNYRFTTKEIKDPIQDAVTACGWTYKGVAFGKL